jgi:UDP:flavonoid glycosyltransferase YjiC (YdhE family)
MRALFTCQPGLGHFLPLTPIAGAMAAAGHDVAFGAPAAFRSAVEDHGFRWVPAGVGRDDPEVAALWARHRTLRGFAQQQFIYEHIFGGVTARRAVPDLLALAETWSPDLVVHDSSEFGGVVAAELLGIPHAQVEVHATGSRPDTMRLAYGPLQRLRADLGLAGRPIQDVIDEHLVLTPFPASLTAPGSPVAPTNRYVYVLPADGTDTLPGWVDRVGSRPLVYVSLGTLWSVWRGREIFATVLEGLRDIDAEVVLTVGHDLDPAALGVQPASIHVERFLPLGALLASCSLVLFHGGSGTLGHVVARGLPMVILPLGADQPENADRCAELGVSRSLDPEALAPGSTRDVVLDVLRTPSYRRNAERLRAEFERLPHVDAVVELLERLARDKVPLSAAR